MMKLTLLLILLSIFSMSAQTPIDLLKKSSESSGYLCSELKKTNNINFLTFVEDSIAIDVGLRVCYCKDILCKVHGLKNGDNKIFGLILLYHFDNKFVYGIKGLDDSASELYNDGVIIHDSTFQKTYFIHYENFFINFKNLYNETFFVFDLDENLNPKKMISFSNGTMENGSILIKRHNKYYQKNFYPGKSNLAEKIEFKELNFIQLKELFSPTFNSNDKRKHSEIESFNFRTIFPLK